MKGFYRIFFGEAFRCKALKIRTDKVLSEILSLNRPKVKRLERSGIIIVTEEKQEHKIIIEIKGNLNSDRTI